MIRTLKKIAWSIAFNMGALYVMVQLFESVTYSGGWAFFLVAGVIIGFLNTFLLPILKFISLPLVFVSAGLFLIVLNAVILWLTDQLLEILDFTTIDFQINGALNFVLAALIFGLTNWFEHFLFKRLR
jgi:putative membrane protein